MLTKNNFPLLLLLFFFFEENYCIVPFSHRWMGPTHYGAHPSVREREHTPGICNNRPFIYVTNIEK